MKTYQKFALLALGFGLFATSCQKEDMGPDGTKPDPGTFKVYMTDSPGDYESLDMEIVRVEAYIEGQGWVTLNSEARTVNVLSLTNGVQTELTAATQAEAKAGLYSHLRIVFGSNNHVTLNSQSALALGGITGSGAVSFDLGLEGEHAIEIDINEEVSADAGAEVLLDFNVAQSVHQYADSFVVQPMLTVIEDARTGVRGHVEGAVSAAATVSNDSGSFSTYINAQGDFLIRGMEDGVYELSIQPNRPEGALADPEPIKIESVVIVDGEITNVGTITYQE